MSQRTRKWLTIFAVALTVGALVALSQRGEGAQEAHIIAEPSGKVVWAPR
ncbi:hypothetical protein [Parvibaculum lavamentivorans]|nr:hypothetical protein [Parvibaculum lavamentivorans]